MPELPEVETIRAGLSKLLPGLVVSDIYYDWDKSFPNATADVQKFLIGATIVEVIRRGKALIIELDTKHSLVIHLRMTGQLVFVQQAARQKLVNDKQKAKDEKTQRGIHKLLTFASETRFGAGHPSDSLIGKLPDKSTRVIFDLTKPGYVRKQLSHSAKLFFNDQRKFGWARLIPTAEVPNIDFFKKLGPEPLSSDFTQELFAQRLKRRPNTNIKAVLLDQTVIAGIGNIYADESLWAAKIHPQTLVKNLSTDQVNTLFTEIRQILELAIKKGGSTDRNYVDAEGKKGSYLSFAKVFRRQGQPCLRCGTAIVKLRVAARGTHVCPGCQNNINLVAL